MGIWILLAIALVLLLLRSREHYVEIEGPGVRPSKTAEWLSKIDAEAPIGGNDDDYLRVLQQFYDQVYLPARTANKSVYIADTEVKAFADKVTIPGVDKRSIERIITAGFAVRRSGSAAAREEQQLVKTGALAGFTGANLEPSMGVDEVRTRKEVTYVPADTRKGRLPEGIYTPVEQQEEPRREGTSAEKTFPRTDLMYYSVCEGGECAKNVL
jgi:hypothetical protein